MRNSSMIDYLFSSKDDKENEESVGVSIIIELITTVIFIAFFIGGRIIPALKVFLIDNINIFLIGVCFIFAGIMLGIYSKSKEKLSDSAKLSIENIADRQKKKLDINNELNKVILEENRNRMWFSAFLLFFILSFILLFVAIESEDNRATSCLILSLFFIVMAIICIYIFRTKKENTKKDFKANCVYTLLKEINPNIRYYRNLTRDGEVEQKENYIKYNYCLEKVEEPNIYDFYLGSSLGENIKIFNINTIDIHRVDTRRVVSNFDGIFTILKKKNDINNVITIKTKELAVDKRTIKINDDFDKTFMIYSEEPKELEHLKPEIYPIIKAFNDRLNPRMEINIFDDVISLKLSTKNSGNTLLNWITTNYKQELMNYFAIYKLMMDLANNII